MSLGTDIQTFQFEGTPFRMLDEAGDWWFVAADASKSMGYTHTPHMLRLLDADEKGVRIVDTPGGPQETTVISEPGLYRAIMQRRVTKKLTPEMKAAIERFQRWVYHDVLPSIRKTGAYHHETVTVAELDEATRRALGGIVKRNAGVVVRQELGPVHADLDAMRRELADLRDKVRPDAIHRAGVTARQIWEQFGLPALKCGTLWLGNRLKNMGAAMEFGLRADIGGKAVRLFDPDKARHCMENGLLNKARTYVAERQGQGRLKLVKRE